MLGNHPLAHKNPIKGRDIRRGRSPVPLPPIYTQCYTFWGKRGCIPVSAAGFKDFKESYLYHSPIAGLIDFVAISLTTGLIDYYGMSPY